MAELPYIEGYRIVAELGWGALSSVYRAIEEPLGRTVALKVLRETVPPSSPLSTQLEREARVLSELSHPNIGLLYGFTKTDTRMYLVLEFVDGFSLAAILKKRNVPPDCVAAIGAAVARGLAHAHARGIVHRNIKPANVLLSRRGDVKIFDFGIAQRSSSAEEPVGLSAPRLEDVAAFGSPAYMSPEQILGESVDTRSDIFSLGVVLYQLICGARPFERGDETDRKPSAHRIRRDPPIPLHRRAPEVPPGLERAIMRALEKAPADRFPTAEAMADRLEELAGAGAAGRPKDKLIMRALAHAGLVTAEDADAVASSPPAERASVRRAVIGLVALAAATMAAGGTLQATAHREGQSAGARPLELVPPSPGYLRVLATPWAEVWVDGQRVDVTPFARRIPVSPGTHYVTLVHPSAPVEKRTVSVQSGETRTVDVLMAVPGLAPKDDAESPPPTAEREGP